MPISLEPSSRPTLGIEEEYQLCDPNTGELVPRVESIMEQADPELRARLSYDLILPLIEANTEISENVEEGLENREFLVVCRGSPALGTRDRVVEKSERTWNAIEIHSNHHSGPNKLANSDYSDYSRPQPRSPTLSNT